MTELEALRWFEEFVRSQPRSCGELSYGRNDKGVYLWFALVGVFRRCPAYDVGGHARLVDAIVALRQMVEGAS